MNYSGDQTLIQDVYIINVTDKIIGGISGYDCLPFIDLQDSSSYLKKYKGYLITGSGNPSGDYGISVDVDYNNIIYFNQVNGSFWKRNTQTTWYSISANSILNIQNIKLNSNGDESKFVLFDLEDGPETGVQTLFMKTQNNKSAAIKLAELSCQSAEAITETQVHVEDSEILLNDHSVTSESQNSNAQYAVKNFDNDTGETPADKYWQWDESRKTFKLVDKTGALLYFNCRNFIIDNIVLTIDYDVVISNQTQFDAIFNPSNLSGTVITIDSSFAYRSIFIRQGNYILKNKYILDKEFLTIISERDTKISLSSALAPVPQNIGSIVIGSYIIGVGQILPDPLFEIISNNTTLKLKIDGMDYMNENFIEINSDHNNLNIDLLNWSSASEYGIIEVTGSHINNIIDIKNYNSVCDYEIYGLQKSFIKGKYTGIIQNNTNNIMNCMINKSMTLMNGDM